ncbi:MAG: NAD-dependent epimerase/dehydratase family protein [Ilumatobacteraceae bacterium]|nr:NAD-dependent epimerase/dehydratase family protein [Ilumatobacteraceae bacterium]
MRVVVTGANGFLGTAVVRRALAVGHDVVGLVRPMTTLTGPLWDDPRVTVVRGDLRERGGWRDGLAGADAVIHLAAAPSGDLGTQFQGTVVATENLLDAIDLSMLRRFVHVSSFSVYDFDAPAVRGVIDETSALEPDPRRRDAYTTTKLIQEQLVRDHLAATGVELVVVRPGAVFGPGKNWAYGAAMSVGSKAVLVFAPRATFRVTYVHNCADAIVAAVDAPRAAGATVNLVDDNLPTHAEFMRLCRIAGANVPAALPVPWLLLSAVGRLAAMVDRRFLDCRAKLPETLAIVRQRARWKPLHYPNAAAKSLLGWSPAVTIADAVRETISAEREVVTPLP